MTLGKMVLSQFVDEGNVFFRAPMLIALVWFLWGLNVFVFQKCNIDYATALKFDHATTLRPGSICASALMAMAGFFVMWLMFFFKWPFADPLVVPSVMYILSVVVLLIPYDVLHRKGRERFIQNLIRVVMPASTGILFVEVVIGDILTSLSKALADLQVSICVLLSHSFQTEIEMPPMGEGMLVGGDGAQMKAADMHMIRTSSQLFTTEQGCAESWMRPLVTSLPFLLRFRQCIVAYRATGDAFPHLVNAAKYASAFPVIWISAFAHHFPASYGSYWRKVWLLSISFNSFFSFMWDIVMDWGLVRKETHYMFLRERLLYVSDPVANGRTRRSANINTTIGESKDSISSGIDTSIDEYNETATDIDPMLPNSAGNGNSGIEKDNGGTGVKINDGDALLHQHPESMEVVREADHSTTNKKQPPVLELKIMSEQDLENSDEENSMFRRRNNNIVTNRINHNNSPTTATEPTSASSIEKKYRVSGDFSLADDGRSRRFQPLLPQTPILYYGAIILDFLLRVLWSFKLSVHLHLSQEGLTFFLEICEVVRRWIWLFFRIEWQCIELDEEYHASGNMSDSESDDVKSLENGTSITKSSPSPNSTNQSLAWDIKSAHPLRARTISDREQKTI